MKKIIGTFILTLLLPCSVNADIFTSQDSVYATETFNLSCDLFDGNEGIHGMDDDNNYIYSDMLLTEFYQVNKNGCREMSSKDVLEFFNSNYYQRYYFNEETYEIYSFESFKHYDVLLEPTTDTEIVPGKMYFIEDSNGNGYQEVKLPKKEELSNYYQNNFYSFPSSTVIGNKDYFTIDLNTGIKTKVDNPVSDDIINYRVQVDEKDVTKEEVVITLDRTIFEPIFNENYLHEIMKINNKLYLFVSNKNNYTTLVYDLNGVLISELDKDVFSYLQFSDSIFGITFGDKIKIYNSNFELVHESEDFLPFELIKNKDYISYASGYDNSGQVVYYNINEHKLLSENSLIFDGKDISIRFSGKLEDLVKVYLNDKELESKAYTTESGSTIIKLKKDYLEKLPAGNYTLKAEYTDGGYSTFNFGIAVDNPKTSDTIVTWIIIGIIAIVGIVVSIICLKKAASNKKIK